MVRAFAIAGVALAVLAIYLLRLDRVAGMTVDDAWYVLLAGAIARGEGYSLVNAPIPGILPTYPPGFPAVLSLIFRLGASFPSNVLLLKTVSIAAMLGTGIVSYRYFSDRLLPAGGDRRVPLLMSIAVVLVPGFVFLATSTVMSECVFTFVQLVTIALLRHQGDRPQHTIAAGVAAGAAILIRSAGVPLVAAGLLFLVLSRRRRDALVFAGAVGLCLAPWYLYVSTRPASEADRLAQGGINAAGYGNQLFMRLAGYPARGYITVWEFPYRIYENAVNVFGRDVAGVVVPALFRGPAESGEEVVSLGGNIVPASMGSARGTMLVSFVLSAIVLVGFVSMARRELTAASLLVPLSLVMTLLWPWWTFRFVLPLTPFLFLYLVAGLQAMTTSWVRIARLALLCVVGLYALDHAQYVFIRFTNPQALDWAADAAEVDTVTTWMQQNLTESGHVATSNPALVYLRTGRRTISADDIPANWRTWKRQGIRYVVALRPADLPSAAECVYTLRYKTTRRGLWIIEL